MRLVQLISAFFVSLLFTGAVGIDVFTHICKEDGIEKAFVINTIDHCESEQEDLPDCCQSDDHEDEDDCCDDEIEHYQVESDYSNSSSLDFPLIKHPSAIRAFSFDFSISVLDELMVFYGIDSGPPPILVSERLSRIQSYLI